MYHVLLVCSCMQVYLDGAFLQTVPSNAYKVTIDSLKPRSLHSASVSAVTGAGEGVKSQVTFQTGDGEPMQCDVMGHEWVRYIASTYMCVCCSAALCNHDTVV